ncbi:MAG: hypothetical protein OJI67_00490 [Prosthecobacter sp.]|nr:hypothetical protein [Prosthecobacter sp.]
MLSQIKEYYFQLASIFRSSRILACDYGHFRSIRERQAVNAVGAPIPWYTYPAIEFLNTLDLSECNVFEFGSGNSSIFWAGRTKHVTSVEDDKQWFEHVQARKQGNQVVLYGKDKASYIAALVNHLQRYDIIVVDGRWRLACIPASIAALKPGGFIVLDNSDRSEEKLCADLLRTNGFFQVDFNGFGAINSYCWSTSIFLKADISITRKLNCGTPVGALAEPSHSDVIA